MAQWNPKATVAAEASAEELAPKTTVAAEARAEALAPVPHHDEASREAKPNQEHLIAEGPQRTPEQHRKEAVGGT